MASQVTQRSVGCCWDAVPWCVDIWSMVRWRVTLVPPLSDITGAPSGRCWSMTSASIWPMRAQSAGWRSCTTTPTPTSWSCWWATRAIWTACAPCPPRRPRTLQVRPAERSLSGLTEERPQRDQPFKDMLVSTCLQSCWLDLCACYQMLLFRKFSIYIVYLFSTIYIVYLFSTIYIVYLYSTIYIVYLFSTIYSILI